MEISKSLLMVVGCLLVFNSKPTFVQKTIDDNF